MSIPSSRRPSKPKPETRDLSRFANGEEDYGINQGANDSKNLQNIIKNLKEFAETISANTLKAVETTAEVVKPENKPPLPQWIMIVAGGALLICLAVGIAVAFNYDNLFSKENQNAALTFVFHFPTAIVSFIVGRKTKGD
jgi:hypothetical protein